MSSWNNGNGRNLDNGLYTGSDQMTRETNIYLIKVIGETFSAEYWDGFRAIINFQEATANFTRLAVPPTNGRFLESKLTQKP